MSTGNSAGAAAFLSYRAFQVAQLVYFGKSAAYRSAPAATLYNALLDVVRYVASTAHRGITCGQSDTPIEIWCDANFALCPDTRRSVTE
jgi:hypothetical protein